MPAKKKKASVHLLIVAIGSLNFSLCDGAHNGPQE
jgi:hypothetical protein